MSEAKELQTLETERLILRKWKIDDLDDLYEYAKNPDAGIMQGWKPFESKEAALTALQSYIKDEFRWAVVLKKNNSAIGSVKLSPDDNRGRYFAKYISYELSAEYWGDGYMPEAVTRVIQFAFYQIQIDILTAFCYPHNVRSKRVIGKCGFTYETTIKQGRTIYTGQTFDTVCYSIMRKDYMTCYCGQDCSKCKIYAATVSGDESLREQSRQFYRDTFGYDIPLADIHCGGARSGDVFYLCAGCPWMKCAKEKGLLSCSGCAEYPCKPLAEYQAKYVNKYNQIGESQ